MEFYFNLRLISVILTVLVHFAGSLSLSHLVQDEWEVFKLSHSKQYNNIVEENYRMKIYLENRHVIAEHNKKQNNTFVLGLNGFGDMKNNEFKQQFNGLLIPQNITLLRSTYGASFMPPLSTKNIPESIDWRKEGYVTEVKNQGPCGSCWAFSATGALEGQHFRKTGKLVSLSEQNLIDCSASYGNNGCNGGLPDYAFKYVKENDGIDTEVSYPYEGKESTCRFSTENIGATGKGLIHLLEGDEYTLKLALATVGPVAVGIDASHKSFQFYKKGIYYEEKCSAARLDHGVLAVGYGTEDGQDYWIVKNSWGKDWGEDGYVRISRNKNNHCGIASLASYPIV